MSRVNNYGVRLSPETRAALRPIMDKLGAAGIAGLLAEIADGAIVCTRKRARVASHAEQIRALLASNPELTTGQIATALGVEASAVSRERSKLRG